MPGSTNCNRVFHVYPASNSSSQSSRMLVISYTISLRRLLVNFAFIFEHKIFLRVEQNSKVLNHTFKSYVKFQELLTMFEFTMRSLLIKQWKEKALNIMVVVFRLSLILQALSLIYIQVFFLIQTNQYDFVQIRVILAEKVQFLSNGLLFEKVKLNPLKTSAMLFQGIIQPTSIISILQQSLKISFDQKAIQTSSIKNKGSRAM